MNRTLLTSFFVLLACLASSQGFRAAAPNLLEAGAGYLMIPAVQKELGLSPGTAKQISNKYMSSMQGMTRPSANRSNPPSQAQAQADFQERIKKMRKIQQDCIALLSPSQKARLKEITIQQLGATAFLNAEVKKAVGVTPPQEKKIGEIVKNGTMRMFSSLSGKGNQPRSSSDMQKRMAEFSKKQAEWQKKMLADSLKTLKPDQQAKWKAIQGKPFKLDMMRAFSAMPRGGGRIN